MKKVFRNILILLYVIIAITITICLLSYNKYRVTVLGETSLIVVESNIFEPDYKKGDLVFVKHHREVELGDKIFYYNSQAGITLGKVEKIQPVTDTQTTYSIEGARPISSDYLIGPVKEDTKSIKNAGAILSILGSKWGFLILIILPTIVIFSYQVFKIFADARENKQKTNRD